MGAIGVAILAAKHVITENKTTSFVGFDASNKEYEVKGFECDGCPNLCEIVEIKANGQILARWGDSCGKWSSNFSCVNNIFQTIYCNLDLVTLAKF